MTSFRRNALVDLLAIAVALTALPHAANANHVAKSQGDAVIAVYDGRYVLSGRAFDSLDKLEPEVRAARPASLLLVACSPGAANAWLAAVPRFEDIPLHLDIADGASPLCPAVSAQAEPAVQRYWSSRMP